ncbi:MAG: hypothetical protein E7485_06460 [Ruminococcaceae bacterium]|nr:hypothetical protein [Oscillospiraceae bacterium]
MAFVVRSAKHKKGTYEGKDYDNINIFCENPYSENEQVLFGPEIEILKVKYTDFTAAFQRNKANGFSMIQEMEGNLIQPVYDKFGNVVDFTLYKAETEPETKTNK